MRFGGCKRDVDMIDLVMIMKLEQVLLGNLFIFVACRPLNFVLWTNYYLLVPGLNYCLTYLEAIISFIPISAVVASKYFAPNLLTESLGCLKSTPCNWQANIYIQKLCK